MKHRFVGFGNFLTLPVFLLLIAAYGAAWSATYTLPAAIGSGPFSTCSGGGPTFNCTGNVTLGGNDILTSSATYTLNITGKFTTGNNAVIGSATYPINIIATDNVKLSNGTVLYGDLTSTKGGSSTTAVEVDNNSKVYGDITANNGKVILGSSSNTDVNGNVSAATIDMGNNAYVTGNCSSSACINSCNGTVPANANCATELTTPVVVTVAASGVGATSATLNGTVTPNQTTAAVSFQYGLTTSYGTTVTGSPGSLSASANASAVTYSLTGLTCNTAYNFRVTATNTAGTSNGSNLTFTTSACGPTATTNAASSPTTTGATLNGTVSSNGASTTVTFEYGTTTGYGSTTTASQSPLASGASGSATSSAISGLTCNTTYNYRVKAVNSAGTTYGSNVTFTTSACPNGCSTSPVGTDTLVTCIADGTVTIPLAVSSVRYLVVGGGGGGGGIGSGSQPGGGGGGAGGVLAGTSLSVTGGSTYTVTVGAGGTAGSNGTDGGTGGNSTFSSITANGGGGGASSGVTDNNGNTGGSGGGGRNSGNGGTGTAGQGNSGGDSGGLTGIAGGGGGGKGAAGSDGGDLTVFIGGGGGSGGNGSTNDITGSSTYYGGGGGGGAYVGLLGATAGTGGFGGGASSSTSRAAGTAGTANTGGGGSGATGSGSGSAFSGGAGGSGIVIVRYSASAVPTVTTNAATSVLATSATLNGTVTSTTAITSLSFGYSTTSGSYTSACPPSPSSYAGATSSQAFSCNLTGLSCATTYYFRASGTNGTGTANGSELSFTTAACPSSFAAYEEAINDTTAAATNSLTVRYIKTRIARSTGSLCQQDGSTCRLRIAAILSGAVASGYTGSVTVGLDYCSNFNRAGLSCSAWSTLVAGSPVTLTSGLGFVTFPNISNAYEMVRVNIVSSSPSLTNYSIDNFAIRPPLLTIDASNGSGTISNSNPQIAGASFTLTADTTLSGYPGNLTTGPVVNTGSTVTTAPTVPQGGTTGTFATGTWPLDVSGKLSSNGSGKLTSTTASYSEAGSVSVTLEDRNFADIDTLDGASSTADRYITSNPTLLTRFKPANFKTRVFQDCSSFAYSGQSFYVLVDAWNQASPPAITKNYFGSTGGVAKAVTLSAVTTGAAGSLSPTALATTEFRSGRTALTGTVAVTSGSTAVTGTGTLFSTELTVGQMVCLVSSCYTVSAIASNTSMTLNKAYSGSTVSGLDMATKALAYTFTSPPQAPATVVVRATESAGGDSVTSEGSTEGSAEIRSGRFKIFDAYGSVSPLNMRAETQYWSGASWIKNVADSCTTTTGGSPQVTFVADSAGWTLTASAITSGEMSSPDRLKLARSTLGSTTINATVPAWLKPDSSAKATIGIYGTKESRKAIHIRELY